MDIKIKPVKLPDDDHTYNVVQWSVDYDGNGSVILHLTMMEVEEGSGPFRVRKYMPMSTPKARYTLADGWKRNNMKKVLALRGEVGDSIASRSGRGFEMVAKFMAQHNLQFAE